MSKLRDIVDSAVQQTALDAEAASELVESMLEDRHRQEIYRCGLRAEIQASIRQQRRLMHATSARNAQRIAAARAAQERSAAQFRRKLELAAQNWFGYPLPTGVYLGDADAETLRVVIAHYREQARYNTRRADFLQAILDRLPEGKTVRQALSSDEIERIAQQHEEQAA